MGRRPGLSVRLKLTLSYAGFLGLASALLLGAVWLFLLRYVPDVTHLPSGGSPGGVPTQFVPNQSDLVRAFAPRAAQALACLLAIGLVGGWLLAGRMLAPLTRITQATRLASTGSLAHRIQLAGRDDEFRELADAVDAMLAQLEADIAEQRRFAANASHELRTPLAITQALLDVARTDPEADADVLHDRLRTVNARAIALTEALLVLSRAGQRSVAPEPVDLSLIAEEAIESLLPLAEAHDVTITTAGDVTPALGSPALLLQLVTNLVQNAIVHNVPARGTVQVTTVVSPGGALLRVENDGEVLAPHLVATLTEPFQRGTERIHSHHAGVGLGLAIVQRIAQAHGGTLNLQPRPAGGLRVDVALPASPPGSLADASPHVTVDQDRSYARPVTAAGS